MSAFDIDVYLARFEGGERIAAAALIALGLMCVMVGSIYAGACLAVKL